MADLEWPLTNWLPPDLDKGYVISRTMTTADVQAMPEKAAQTVYRAAERYAKAANKAGIAVTADEWVLAGKEADV